MNRLRILACFLLLFAATSCVRKKAAVKIPSDKEWVKAEDYKGNVPEFMGEEYTAALTDDDYKPYDPSEYTIEVGDLLEVSIFGHGELMSSDIPVAPDGHLYYYFLDGIPAAGRSPTDVAAQIEENIRHLFANPEVSIIPKDITTSTYVILGKVQQPGEYTIDSAVTLRQAIGSAGGLASGGYRGSSINVAALDHSFVMRGGKKLPIDFKKLLAEDDPDNSQDIYVRPGDYIYIASGLIHKVYKLGAVPENRAVTWTDDLTLLGLLTGYSGQDGGFHSAVPSTSAAGYSHYRSTDYGGGIGIDLPYRQEAAIDRILVIRGALDKPNVMVVNLEDVFTAKANDIYLVPGDIVYVPEKKHKFTRHLIKRAILTFVSSFSGNAGAHFTEEWLD